MCYSYKRWQIYRPHVYKSDLLLILVFKSSQTSRSYLLQSNPFKWIALGPDCESPVRQNIHLSMFYTLHCV